MSNSCCGASHLRKVWSQVQTHLFKGIVASTMVGWEVNAMSLLCKRENRYEVAPAENMDANARNMMSWESANAELVVQKRGSFYGWYCTPGAANAAGSPQMQRHATLVKLAGASMLSQQRSRRCDPFVCRCSIVGKYYVVEGLAHFYFTILSFGARFEAILEGIFSNSMSTYLYGCY